MNFIKILSRNEMKQIMAGCSCCVGCTDFAGDCIEACLAAYDPSDGMRSYYLNTCEAETDSCMSLCVQ